jgi:hypothetical protein
VILDNLQEFFQNKFGLVLPVVLINLGIVMGCFLFEGNFASVGIRTALRSRVTYRVYNWTHNCRLFGVDCVVNRRPKHEER